MTPSIGSWSSLRYLRRMIMRQPKSRLPTSVLRHSVELALTGVAAQLSVLPPTGPPAEMLTVLRALWSSTRAL